MQKLLTEGLIGILGYGESRPALFLTGILCVVIPYLLGSINFALIFSRTLYHDDVRKYGSGNAGSTNMLRTYGWRAALLTFLCDMVKAALATAIGLVVMPYYTSFAYISGFFCLLGHAYPLFHGFRGGKCVASTAGILLVLNPPLFALLFITFILIVAIWGYVSLASIVCAAIIPPLNCFLPFWFSPVPPVAILVSLGVAVLVVILHRKNLARLWKGEETKISFRPDKK